MRQEGGGNQCCWLRTSRGAKAVAKNLYDRDETMAAEARLRRPSNNLRAGSGLPLRVFHDMGEG